MCSEEFCHEPEEPILCRDHPQAKLKLKNDSQIRFFDGCSVVGIAVPSGPHIMRGVSPATYCKLTFDLDNKYWRWVEELPQVISENVVTEINNEDRKYHSLLDRLVYWFGHDEPIWYSPGYPVGVLKFLPHRFISCTFDVAEKIQVSFQPDGIVDLKVIGNIVSQNNYSDELYQLIIGEVFSVAYDVDRGWIWVKKEIEALEKYETERNKRREAWRVKGEADRKTSLMKKREKADSSLENTRFLFKPKE